MRVVLALVGSRGDVQPALPIARALRERGHGVVTAVPPNLCGLAERLDLDPVPIGIDSRALLASDLVRRDLRARDPRRRLRALREVASQGWDELRVGLVPLAEQADLVVTGLLGQEVAAAVTERVGTGFAALHWCPVRANASVPLVPRGGPRVQRAAWRAGERVRWALTRAAEQRQRRLLGLPPARAHLPERLRERGVLEVQAYDAALVPGLAQDWDGRRPLTGFPGLSEADRARLHGPLDEGLAAWLSDGPPPVYVGFGSMPLRDPGALVETLREAARRLGVRVLLSSGWNDLDAAGGADLRVVGPVDHAQVLPRCAAAVHHGGAGTVAATLRAGLPAVVGWHSADQPMWGRLLERAPGGAVGVAAPVGRLDGARLVDALARVLSDGVRRRARELGHRLVGPQEASERAAAALEAVG